MTSARIIGPVISSRQWATVFAPRRERERPLLGSALTAYASASPLELGSIRRSLILMEDTIIFSLIERGQFAQNSPVYQPGATVQQYLKDIGRQLSLLEYLLMETVRRLVWLFHSSVVTCQSSLVSRHSLVVHLFVIVIWDRSTCMARFGGSVTRRKTPSSRTTFPR